MQIEGCWRVQGTQQKAGAGGQVGPSFCFANLTFASNAVSLPAEGPSLRVSAELGEW